MIPGLLTRLAVPEDADHGSGGDEGLPGDRFPIAPRLPAGHPPPEPTGPLQV